LTKQLIKLHFQNGLTFDDFKKGVFDIDHLSEFYQFEESSEPDFIIFGPYGNDIPTPGDYIRIGYFCENFMPDMSICEWAFGIPHEEEVKHPNYKRIQWHGLDPQKLVKSPAYDAEKIANGKSRFCNFLYSHKVPYREEFFRQLSTYKKIDAPGRSMNNMQSIDDLYKGNLWERKKQFLSAYKFTIAFENYVYPGYQTEKIYDAMQVGSIPIYCGDPLIGDIFNVNSFINTAGYIDTRNTAIVTWLQKYSQPDFVDMRPAFYKKPQHRIKRKLKAIGRRYKMCYQFQNLDFTPLIDRIIELDQDRDKYLSVLQEPWFVNNQPPTNTSLKDRWIEIFSKAKLLK
jgi:hypothetical protein